MPRNSAGTYNLPSNSFNPAVVDTDIDPDAWNDTANDLAVALTQSIAADGQTPTVARIPFANGISVSGGVQTDTATATSISVSGTASLPGTVDLGSGKRIGEIYINGGTVTAAATLDIAATGFTSYVLRLRNTDPATSNAVLQVQFSEDGGATYAGVYSYVGSALSTAGGATPFQAPASTSILMSSVGLGNATGYNHSVDLRINSNTGSNPVCFWHAWFADTVNNLYSVTGGGRQTVGVAIDHIRVSFATGNIATATWALYGLTA